jgi:hypothetical protein
MRALFLSTSPTLPQLIGGAQWSLHHFARGLARRGYDVAAVAALRNSGSLGLRNKLQRHLTKISFPIDWSMGYPTARGWDLAQGLREMIASFEPDVVLVIGIGSQPVPHALKLMALGIPIVYLVMDVAFEGHGGPLSELHRAVFVSNSAFTAARLAERYGCLSTVIRPPISISGCLVSGNGHKVVMINPQRSKGGVIALALADARPDISFVFQEAWSGDISDIKKQAQRLRNIEWRAPVNDPRKVYREARIVLAPSQAEEAWGMVASEAHCSGIPVLGSEIGGLTESIGPGGIRVAPDAPLEAWLDGLSELWDDRQRWAEVSRAASEYSRRTEIQLDHQIAALDGVIHAALTQKTNRKILN